MKNGKNLYYIKVQYLHHISKAKGVSLVYAKNLHEQHVQQHIANNCKLIISTYHVEKCSMVTK